MQANGGSSGSDATGSSYQSKNNLNPSSYQTVYNNKRFSGERKKKD